MPVCDGDLLHECFAGEATVRIIRANEPRVHGI